MYEMGQDEIDAVAEVIRTGQLFRYRGGEDGKVARCEQVIRQRQGCREALVVSSGTGALICGLVGLGIGPGDEVIVPAYTWLASAGAVLAVGAIPVLAEIDESLMLDPADLERRIGPRTKAVIPVHMAGHPCAMDRLMAVARAHGLSVLEDACQAVGGTFRGQALGAIGDAGAFSFNQFKIISCGEGGVLMTGSRQVFERALYHHDMGCTFRGHAGQMTEPPFLGNTYRMNEILGAVLLVQLGRIDGILARLRERRDWLLEAVGQGVDGCFQPIPSADPAGDCGCRVDFTFADAQVRRDVERRVQAMRPDCRIDSPIDHGLHVYTNWTVLLERRGGLHPDMNPFLRPENRSCRLDIAADACPRTLDILARTASVTIGLGMTREDCAAIAAALCQAAREAC